jgi:parallel beta-helix repeat protein
MKSNHVKQIANIRQNHSYFFVCIFLCIISYSLPATAHPSGGPYGPIRQSYDLPEVTGQIYYVSPDGKAEESGKTLAQPTTLAAAIERVVTGDAIVLRGGTYRTGGLKLNQGITMQPYKDEQPVLKGTRAATEWESLDNNVWRTSWKTLFPAKPLSWWRGHRRTPLHRFNNDMVFVDGEMLMSAGSEDELDPHSYFIDYEKGQVYIGVDPANRLVEITAFDGAIVRTSKPVHGKTNDHKGPVIRGITFTQYAWRAIEIEGKRSFGPNDEPTDEPLGPADPATYGKEVMGTTLENVAITFCSRVAGYFRGDGLTIRRCLFSDTSTEGVYVIGSSDVLLEKNIFRRNNVERITGYFPAAVKIFNQSHRVTCRDNLVIDLPYSNGIWYDVGNEDGVFINNWVEGVGIPGREFRNNRFWPSDSGFFFEISKGAICAGNVFVNCDQGIYVINSSDVQIFQNTLVNSTVCIMRTPRSAASDHFGWHPSTGPDVDERDGHVVVNNLLTGDANYHRPLLAIAQTPSLREQLKKPQLKQLDYNMYVRSSEATSIPLILWSPADNDDCQLPLESPEALQKMYPEFSVKDRYFANYNGPLFKSVELGNYKLLKAFPGSTTASPLPSEIRELLGLTKQDTPFIGAYPPLR